MRWSVGALSTKCTLAPRLITATILSFTLAPHPHPESRRLTIKSRSLTHRIGNPAIRAGK